MEIPSWDECARRLENKRFSDKYGYTQTVEEAPTPLHVLIYENEPAEPTQAEWFRRQVADLVNWLQS